MEKVKVNRIAIKWFVLLVLFSLNLFVKKLYAGRIYIENPHEFAVEAILYNQNHQQCLKRCLGPGKQIFIDLSAQMSICTSPINKIDLFNIETGKYIGTVQGKNALFNTDIIIH